MSSEECQVEKPESQDKSQTFILQTAGFDARFPNTNQTKHCWQYYVDYYRCLNQSDDKSACQGFFRTFHSLCPNRWIERWDEQREAGKFPVRLD
ncbi:hypothetical protein O181_011134 [Austropuccinia psidii MF-1]|uniref:Cytochrome c oxidase subunit n=1 Tax=Austropuccinia psidii MF-1 TaxID=1389203 RepID=A0A9Q3BSB9_9BASI|nr:hypothetical protein [Austropuccinia psidii MF-1]